MKLVNMRWILCLIINNKPLLIQKNLIRISVFIPQRNVFNVAFIVFSVTLTKWYK
jgi:hypothetical protein